MPSSARRLFLVLAFSGAYFAVARASLAFATLNGHASPVWPAAGLAIGAVACCGGEFALGAALGSFLANLTVGSPMAAVLGMTVGNGLEAWVGGALAAGVLRRRTLFEHQSELAAVLGAALVATPISATAGAVSLAATATIPWSAAGATWVTWWTGNALGIIVVAPFLLRMRGARATGAGAVEAEASSGAGLRSTDPLGPGPLAASAPGWASAGLVGAVVLGLWVVFWTASDRSLLFALFPLLLAATWLWGTWGVSLLTAVVCAAAILATSRGGGPFEAGTLNANLLSLQLFLGSVGLTGLALAGFARAEALRGASVVLCVGWLVTGVVFRSFDVANRARQAEAFGDLVEDAEAALRHRMNLYEDALWGGVSLVHALPGLTGEDWRTYAETLDLPARYPGIRGIGVVWPVASDEEDAFVARIRSEPGNDAFRVRSVPRVAPGEAQDRFVITYLEPRAPNLAAVGLDLGSEPRRREAAERARDTGKSAMTDPITLVQAEEGRAGFLLYLPIYAGTAIPDTVEGRRRAHLGWVYAPFLTDQFVERALHRFEGQLEYRVYGGTDPSELEPLLDTTTSDRPATRLRPLQLAGQTLTFAWSQPPGSAGSADLTAASAGALGALVTVLLASVASSLQSIGIRAQALADEQTKRLRASEERFALAVHGSHDGIWDWDLILDEVYFSPRWKEMLGYADTALPNRFETWRGLQHPDDLDRVLEALDGYLSGRHPTYEVESRLRHADGSWRWILQRGTAVRDAAGRPVRMAGSHTDVTAQREAEGRVRQSEAFLESIVENLPIMVFVKDASDLQFVRVNRAGEQVLGRDRSELLGRNDADVLPPDAARAAAEADREVLAGHSVVAVSEERLPNPGGDDRVLHTRKIPIRDDSGRPRYLLGISEDVTERLRSERELRAAKEAALEGTRAKSEFLANMSHEIRTPINGIVGMGSLLAGTPLTEEQREYVEGIATSAEGLLGIVSDILDFSKVEAGRLELEAIEVTLPDVLHDVEATLRVAAETKGLGFSSTWDPPVASPRIGDPTRIRQVLLNLVSNAVKFTAAGRVDVRLLAGPGDTVRFEVDDTGVGIPDDLRSRLFQPFTQADASTTRRFGGTGLGLSISKRLVEAMGGSIGCASREGAGTRFWFELPLPPAAGTSPPSPERAVAPRSGRILVGEDNPVSQLVTQRLLERLGHEVVVAASGDDVLAALSRGRYDVILMDCQMPGRDGWETTAAIRQGGGEHRDIPIVALTANALRGDRERCLAAGMNDYLAKPYTPATLAEVVARWLREPVAGPPADEGLDAGALDRLAALGEAAGSDFLAEFVERWISDTRPRVEALRAASTAGDLDQVRALAHSLKASSGFVGATRVAELCRSLEEDGAGAEARDERLAHLEEAVTRACRHLADDLERRRATTA